MVVEHRYSVGPSTPLPNYKANCSRSSSTHLRGRVDVPRPDGPIWTTVELVLWVAILSGPLNSASNSSQVSQQISDSQLHLDHQRPRQSAKLQEQRAPTFPTIAKCRSGQVRNILKRAHQRSSNSRSSFFKLRRNVEPGQDSVSRIPTPQAVYALSPSWSTDDPSKPFIPDTFVRIPAARLSRISPRDRCRKFILQPGSYFF